MAGKAKKRKGPRPSVGMAQLARIADFMLEKDFETAYDMLSLFLERHPDSVPGLQMMTDAADEIGDTVESWRCSWKLARLIPNEPMAVFNAANFSIALALPFAALHYAEQYLKRWPDGEYAADVRELQDQVQQLAEAIRDDDPVNTDHPLAHLALLEECNLLTSMGYVREGRAWCQHAIKQMPEVAAPRNNLASSYAVEGDLEEAIRIQRETVAKFPTNYHARCNLAQFLARYGQRDEARQMVAQLEREDLSKYETVAKLIETLSFVGDDAGLVWLYNILHADKRRWETLSPHDRHLLAVGLARSGEVKEAEKIWKQALKDFRELEVVRDNLDDLKADVRERSGAWPFAMNYWIPSEWIEELILTTERSTSENAMQRAITNALKSRPALRHILPVLLERGDPIARRFALQLLKYQPIPELVDYLRSPFGTDSDRLLASQIAVEAGLLARGQTTPMYQGGEIRDLLLMNYEISDEPERSTLPKKALDALQQSIEETRAGEYEEALRLARLGLAIAPNDPSLLNQEAILLQAKGQKAESRTLFQSLAERYPDYLFARCAMARLCVEDKQFEKAQEWLQSVMGREKFHVSEFVAFAISYIELLDARGEREGARQWLEMWEQADPDHPGIPIYRRRLGVK